MIVLISPSKTQEFNCDNVATYTLPVCLEQTWELVKTLQKYSVDELAGLMHLSPKLAELNFGRFQNFKKNFDLTTGRQALLAFRGDVYSGITADSYTDADFDFAQSHLRIISGLYGVLTPLDIIQPYRLEMGTKLGTEGAANLYDFWGSRLTEIINQDLQKTASSVVINLASNEYAKAIKEKELNGEMVSVVFKEKKGDSYKVIAIHAKRARGLLVDFIVKNRLKRPADLCKFSGNGYIFNEKQSTEKELVFCR